MKALYDYMLQNNILLYNKYVSMNREVRKEMLEKEYDKLNEALRNIYIPREHWSYKFFKESMECKRYGKIYIKIWLFIVKIIYKKQVKYRYKLKAKISRLEKILGYGWEYNFQPKWFNDENNISNTDDQPRIVKRRL